MERHAFSAEAACRSIERHAKPAENKRTEIERPAFSQLLTRKKNTKKIIEKLAD